MTGSCAIYYCCRTKGPVWRPHPTNSCCCWRRASASMHSFMAHCEHTR